MHASHLRRLLARANLASVREADAYVARGWAWFEPDGVAVARSQVRETNGNAVFVAAPGGGAIALDPRAVRDQGERLAGGVVLNKPYSFLSHRAARSRSRDAKTILTLSNGPREVQQRGPAALAGMGMAAEPAGVHDLHVTGRLDSDSVGVLLFTRSGLLGRHLTAAEDGGDEASADRADAAFAFEKEYLVRVTPKLKAALTQRELDSAAAALGGGALELDGRRVLPAGVRWLHDGVLQFVLTEGRHRQIRRMCEIVGLDVVNLKRVRVGGVRLGRLPVGRWRPFSVEELIPRREDREALVPLFEATRALARGDGKRRSGRGEGGDVNGSRGRRRRRGGRGLHSGGGVRL